jgi:preprotein translocase subunit SecA
MYWVEHLEVMDYTRSSVSLRAYGQRDPLVEYKKEGLRLFKEMQYATREQVVKILPHIMPVDSARASDTNNIGQDKASKAIHANEMTNLKEVHENAQMIGSGDGGDNSAVEKKENIGRNELCPCGSGKKYKKCHGV